MLPGEFNFYSCVTKIEALFHSTSLVPFPGLKRVGRISVDEFATSVSIRLAFSKFLVTPVVYPHQPIHTENHQLFKIRILSLFLSFSCEVDDL